MKTSTKTEQVEDINNLPPVSHPSHGSTPGQVDHMITSLNDDWLICKNWFKSHLGDDTRPG